MTTLPFYDPTSIANRALREVPDRQIADITEASLQGRECAAAYPDCLAELLEDQPWEFAVSRVTLARIVNDRSGEWAYAYALPDTAAYVGRLLASDALGTIGGAQVISTNASYAYRGPDYGADLNARAVSYPKLIAGNILYTDCPGSVAEITLNVLPEARFTPLFVRALALRMAVRMTPTLKKAEASRELLSREELAVGRAKAADGNRQRETYGDFMPDWMACR